jgi:hypothetical protein
LTGSVELSDGAERCSAVFAGDAFLACQAAGAAAGCVMTLSDFTVATMDGQQCARSLRFGAPPASGVHRRPRR